MTPRSNIEPGRANPPGEPKARLGRAASPYQSALLGLIFACTAVIPLAKAVEPRPTPKVDTFYFHRTLRCPSCNDIEAYTAEALGHFPAERKAGTLTWSAINLDDEKNRHFEKDYALEFNSVVLSRRVNGQEVAWTNLPDVWKLVGDKPTFIAYIESEIRMQLNQLPEEKDHGSP